MECKFCRNELPKDAKFCPICGAPVETEETLEEAVVEPVQPVQESMQEERQEESGYDTPAEEMQEQPPYQYGAPDQEQPQYQYGAPDQGQPQYQYGAPDQGQPQYQYGTPNQGQPQYQYGASDQGQPQYQYGVPNQEQLQYQYGSQKQLNGTPYMIFAILTTLFCCIPFGIASIVFAGRINSLQRTGDYVGAQNAAKKARLFSIISAVTGFVVLLIWIIAIIAIGLDDDSSYTPYDQSVVEDWDDDVADERFNIAPAEQSGDLGNVWDSYTVQVNDTVLTLPCTVEELESIGMTWDDDYIPEDYMVNVGEYELGYFEDVYGNDIMVYLVNETDKAKTAKECLVGGIFIDAYELDEGGITVIFPAGIQIGSDIDTVLAAYGDATEVYEGDSVHMYTWYGAEDDYDRYCEIHVDSGTKLVTDMIMINMGE